MSQDRKGEAADELLTWYARHRRKLPWRAGPGENADPYRVWLSEIMLQQTTVAAVGAYFIRFTARWPTVETLAAAPLDDVLAEWAGLGYYARARNLHACAKIVASDHGGQFPQTRDGLQMLPGIGAYTSGAIAAIAFGQPEPAVDGNVERVISRLCAITAELPGIKPQITQETRSMIPEHAPGDFAQALMDLGATVCTPKSPNCLICPWLERCNARMQGIEAELPRKKVKKPRPTRHAIAFWVERGDGAILLRRRPEKGLLGGMLEVPSTPWTETGSASPASDAPVNAQWSELAGTVEHTFTHFHLVFNVWTTKVPVDSQPNRSGEWRWVRPDTMAELALPTVMKKIAHAAGRPVSARPRPEVARR